MPKAPGNLKDIRSLVEIVAALRGPGGCPWDLEQTHRSLARYAIEEAHEMVEALEERETLRPKAAEKPRRAERPAGTYATTATPRIESLAELEGKLREIEAGMAAR